MQKYATASKEIFAALTAITPAIEDEAAFRAEGRLPAMSKAVKGAWEEDKGFRRPITLLTKTDEAVAKQELTTEDDE